MRQTFATVSLLMLLCASPCASGDDIRERQLELDVEQLRRELQAQSRRIDQLERGSRSADLSAATSTQKAPPAPPKVPAWLVTANWDRVRPGMSGDEVTKILGPATSERAGETGGTLFLYGLEIQEGVFLAGRVEFQDGKVSAVKKPALR